MFGFFKKRQKPEKPDKKEQDFKKFCEENEDMLDYPDVPDESRDRGYPLDDSWMTPEIKAACDKRRGEYENMMDYPDVPTGEGARNIEEPENDKDALEAMEVARKAHEARKPK